MRFVIRLIIHAFFLLGISYLFHSIHIQSFFTAVIAALVLTILNAFVKPILSFFSFPITFLTLGIFSLVINAWMLLLTAHFVKGFTITSFWGAFFGAIVLSIASSFVDRETK